MCRTHAKAATRGQRNIGELSWKKARSPMGGRESEERGGEGREREEKKGIPRILSRVLSWQAAWTNIDVAVMKYFRGATPPRFLAYQAWHSTQRGKCDTMYEHVLYVRTYLKASNTPFDESCVRTCLRERRHPSDTFRH